MNKRIDYLYRALVLRLLIMLVEHFANIHRLDNPDTKDDVRRMCLHAEKLADECGQISDGTKHL